MKFWNWPSLSNETVSFVWPKSHDKNLNTWERKEFLRWNKSKIFINIQELSVAKNRHRTETPPLTYINY